MMVNWPFATVAVTYVPRARVRTFGGPALTILNDIRHRRLPSLRRLTNVSRSASGPMPGTPTSAGIGPTGPKNLVVNGLNAVSEKDFWASGKSPSYHPPGLWFHPPLQVRLPRQPHHPQRVAGQRQSPVFVRLPLLLRRLPWLRRLRWLPWNALKLAQSQ